MRPPGTNSLWKDFKMNPRQSNIGKWVVVGLLIVGMIGATLRWVLVPKTNPRKADPGNPFYSREKPTLPEPAPTSPR
jgi:hypothetical protein